MSIHAPEPQAKRWTRDEFYELAEQGYFRGKRVQLIDGEIIEMAPQGHAHSWAITRLNRWATTNYPLPALVRVQMPLNASARSDPEPDLAIIPDPSLAASDHPETAELVIEVSDSSLRLDRRKAAIYAECGVHEYWIVNIAESHVEVHRRPLPAERRYADISNVRAPQTLSPASRPEAQLPIVELFV
jgi:Uma2 family endonuclease